MLEKLEFSGVTTEQGIIDLFKDYELESLPEQLAGYIVDLEEDKLLELCSALFEIEGEDVDEQDGFSVKEVLEAKSRGTEINEETRANLENWAGEVINRILESDEYGDLEGAKETEESE